MALLKCVLSFLFFRTSSGPGVFFSYVPQYTTNIKYTFMSCIIKKGHPLSTPLWCQLACILFLHLIIATFLCHGISIHFYAILHVDIDVFMLDGYRSHPEKQGQIPSQRTLVKQNDITVRPNRRIIQQKTGGGERDRARARDHSWSERLMFRPPMDTQCTHLDSSIKRVATV